MESVRFEPSVPIEIELAFDSPQAVSYALFKRPAGGTTYTTFASGTDEEGIEVSGHHHRVGPVPAGTTIKYRLIFGGNPGSPIKAEIVFRQNGMALVDATYSERGACDQDGVAVRSREITFNA